MPQVHAYVYELLFTKRNEEACWIVRRTYVCTYAAGSAETPRGVVVQVKHRDSKDGEKEKPRAESFQKSLIAGMTAGKYR